MSHEYSFARAKNVSANFRQTCLRGAALTVLASLTPLSALAAPIEIVTRSTTARTSTANNGSAADVLVKSNATVTPASGPGLIVDSANTATNEGTITREDAVAGPQVVITPGVGRSFINKGSITISDGYTRKTDGEFARGENRIGILVGAAGQTTEANIKLESGSVNVDGNDSAAIRFAGAFKGDFTNLGSISVTGQRSYAIDITGPFTGNIDIRGNVTAFGPDASALRLLDKLTGNFEISGNISNTAYSSTGRGVIKTPDSDDALQAAAAIDIRASITGGFHLAGIGVENDTDDDGDGILDDAKTDPDKDDNRTASVSMYGSAPAVSIQSQGTDTLTLGLVKRFGAGFVNRGSVTANGVFDNRSAIAVLISGKVVIDGGILNQGTISATAYKADATGLKLFGTSIDLIRNTNVIAATSIEGSTSKAIGLLIDGTSSTPLKLVNSGTIGAAIMTGSGTATAVKDTTGRLTTIENSGTIRAALGKNADKDAIATGDAIALDLSANTTGITFRQFKAPADTEDDAKDNVVATDPKVIGDIKLGSGDDRFEVSSGTVESRIYFGQGKDKLIISGGLVKAQLFDSDGQLDISATGGVLHTTNTAPVVASSVNFGLGSKWKFDIDMVNGTVSGFDVSGAATFATGSQIEAAFIGTRAAPLTVTLIRAGNLTWDIQGNGSDLLGLPFLYSSSFERISNEVKLTIRTKTVSELGLGVQEAKAFDAFMETAAKSKALSAGMNQLKEGKAWRSGYRNLLPDYTDGKVSLAMAGERGAAAIIRSLVDRHEEQPDLTVWAQEFNYSDNLTSKTEQSRKGGGFGLSMGAATWLGPIDLVGLTATFTTGSYDRDNATYRTPEAFSRSSVSLGTFMIYTAGLLRVDFSFNGGYGWSKSHRRLLALGPDGTAASAVDVTARGSSTGWNIGSSGQLSLLYPITKSFGLGPFVSFDTVKVSDKGYTEKGAGDLGLIVKEHSASRGLGRVGGEIFSRFGDSLDWKLSLQGGVTQSLFDTDSGHNSRYIGGTKWFELQTPLNRDSGAFAGMHLQFDSLYGLGALRLDWEDQGDRQSFNSSIAFTYRF